MLGSLPSRKALSGEVEDAAYAIVMEGMTAYGLESAVKAALRGEHGSEFFPHPPQLKALYDKAMEWHERERQRIARQERMERERREHEPRAEPTPQARARVAAAMAKFNAGIEEQKRANEEAERAEVRARYGMSPESLASIPDASSDWRKLGK